MPSSNPEPLDSSTPAKYALKPWQQMIASGSGGLLTAIFMTPFDVVKIRMQAQTKEFTSHKCFIYCNGITEHLCACGYTHETVPARKKYNTRAGHVRLLPPKDWYMRPSKFNGTIDAFSTIARTEGISSLWSGLPPTLVISIPNVVLYFTTYEYLRDKLFDLHVGVARLISRYSLSAPWGTGLAYSVRDFSATRPTEKRYSISAKHAENGRENRELPFWIPLTAGGIARTVAVTCTNPIELVRTKLQSERLSYREIRSAVESLLKAKGITGLWMGLPPTLMRDVPFSAIYWSCLEGLKTAFDQRTPNPSFSFFAGALSGGLAAVVTLPFDIVKTHRQISLGDAELYSSKPKNSKKMMTILRELYRAEGVSALFTGITPRLLKVMPACAIMISSYEAMKNLFHPT
ncbi:unnamed protein product [Notodromas monacha]|uniref:Solute carrier family 25 member 40 n=1 Tax=Notodromas monacha TaxID=399045 RepID=A0A7R9BGD9_9CRUS|nr:unnamed protein product [Notodromas monacha]CAG0914124.1 unnamed protein product [Notodromas monacha]